MCARERKRERERAQERERDKREIELWVLRCEPNKWNIVHRLPKGTHFKTDAI